MSFIDFNVDLSRVAIALERIADAFDRAVPSPPAADIAGAPGDANAHDAFYLAESPAEWQERQSHEAMLAASLGVAPWSPDFQAAITAMRDALMRRRMEINDEGNPVWREAATQAEAEDILRRAFREVKAQANTR